MDNTKNMIYMMLSNQIAKYVGNDMYSPMIYVGLSSVMNFSNFSLDFSENIIWFMVITITFSVLSFASYKYYIFYRDDKLFKITFYNIEDISEFIKYLEITDSIVKNNNLVYGNLQDLLNLKAGFINVILPPSSKRNPEGLKIYFKNKEDQLEGYYYYQKGSLETKITEESKTTTRNYEHPYLIVVFTRFEKYTNVGFIKDMINKRNKKYDKRNINLFYVKVISHYNNEEKRYQLENHSVNFYKSRLETDRNYYDNIFKNFFHNNKKHIMSKVYALEKNPESKISLLLHGPAGTGKSSFAFRLAKYFNKHIVSFEINKMSKIELFRLFDTPFVYGQRKSCEDVVFVFDEFDKCFFEIYEREMMNKKLFEERIRSSFLSHDEEDDKGKIPLDDNSIKLNDLLELFQGVIPREGSIVIATTNHFEEINKLFPSLFRAGRLTPVYFGLLNKESFNELCLHYYEKDFPRDLPDSIKITPSEIIEMTGEMDFETFVESIMKKL